MYVIASGHAVGKGVLLISQELFGNEINLQVWSMYICVHNIYIHIAV